MDTSDRLWPRSPQKSDDLIWKAGGEQPGESHEDAEEVRIKAFRFYQFRLLIGFGDKVRIIS